MVKWQRYCEDRDPHLAYTARYPSDRAANLELRCISKTPMGPFSPFLSTCPCRTVISGSGIQASLGFMRWGREPKRVLLPYSSSKHGSTAICWQHRIRFDVTSMWTERGLLIQWTACSNLYLPLSNWWTSPTATVSSDCKRGRPHGLPSRHPLKGTCWGPGVPSGSIYFNMLLRRPDLLYY